MKISIVCIPSMQVNLLCSKKKKEKIEETYTVLSLFHQSQQAVTKQMIQPDLNVMEVAPTMRIHVCTGNVYVLFV